MAAKQQFIQRARQRILDKLNDIEQHEEILHSIICEHVAKVKSRATTVVNLGDSRQFLQQYGSVQAELDAFDLLAASLEDMIESGPGKMDNFDEDYLVDLTFSNTSQLQTPDWTSTPKAVPVNQTMKTCEADFSGIAAAKETESPTTSELNEVPLDDGRSSSKSGKTSISQARKATKSTKVITAKGTGKGAKMSTTCQDTSKKVSKSVPDVVKKQLAAVTDGLIVGGFIEGASKLEDCKDANIVIESIKGKQKFDDVSIMTEKASQELESQRRSSFSEISTDGMASLKNTQQKETQRLRKFDVEVLKDNSSNEPLPKCESLIETVDRIGKKSVSEKSVQVSRSSSLSSKASNSAAAAVVAKVEQKSGDMDDEAKHQKKIQGICITQTTLPTGKTTPVLVCDITSPWCFYVQPYGTQLTHLMEQICDYMKDTGLREPALHNPEVGTICLAQFSKDGAFYRSIITKTKTSGTAGEVTQVEVIYLDYGNRERMSVSHTRKLPHIFTFFPSQAVCCSLAEVMPGNTYKVWTEQDIHIFTSYVAGKQIDCFPVCRSSNIAMPCLVQLMVSIPSPSVLGCPTFLSHANIGQVLISKGSAKAVDVAQQMSMLIKSLSWDESFLVFQQHNADQCGAGGGLKIRELSDREKGENETVCLNLASLSSASAAFVESGTKDCSTAMPVGGDMVSESERLQADGEKEKSAPLISPRTEASDTESALSLSSVKLDTTSSQGDTKRQTNICEETDGKGDILASSVKTEQSSVKTEPSSVKTEPSSVKSKSDVSAFTDTVSSDLQKSTADKEPRRTNFEEGSEGVKANISCDNDSLIGEINKDVNQNHQGQGYQVMVAHVTSPDLFYVHIVSRQIGQMLNKLMQSLNHHFEKFNGRKLQKLSKDFPSDINKPCCARYTGDNFFYRGLIIEKETSASSQGRIHVYYPDFGDNEWMPKLMVYPLPQEFVNIPALVVRCNLACIRPAPSIGTDGLDEDRVWDKMAVEKFSELVGSERPLIMHIIEGNLSLDTEGSILDALSDKHTSPLSVLLVDSVGKEELCINMALIKSGHAVVDSTSVTSPYGASPATDPSGASPNLKNHDLREWNPMAEDFFSERNSYNIDVDDPGVATVGYKAGDDRVCRFFQRGDCWRGERCHLRHVAESAVTQKQSEVFTDIIGNEQENLLPDVGSWVAMEICTILTPGRFYVILPIGRSSLDCVGTEKEEPNRSYLDLVGDTETLEELQLSLNEEYGPRRSTFTSEHLLAPGEIVVARFSQDQQWYRARIVSVTEKELKVFFLDFGNSEWRTMKDIDEIKPQFLHLPFQALECFLHSIEPSAESCVWSLEAKAAFRELVDGKTLVGHVISRSWNGSLWVELYDTNESDDINIGEELISLGHAHQSASQYSTTSGSSTSTSRRSSVGSVKFVPG